MPRELNPELNLKTRVQDQGPAKPIHESTQPEFHLKNKDFVSNSGSDEDFRRQVNFQLEQIRRQQRETHGQVENLYKALRQTQEIQRLRSEEIKLVQREVEAYVTEALQRQNSKFSVRIGRIHEKLAQEGKVQEIIDRHNQIVQRFEMKLEQLQKLMGEQDIKLLSYSDTLREIRRQLPPR